jgi:hypothetical protein
VDAEVDEQPAGSLAYVLCRSVVPVGGVSSVDTADQLDSMFGSELLD